MAVLEFECCDVIDRVEDDGKIRHCEFCGKVIEPKQGYTWWGENNDEILAEMMIYGPGAVVYDWDEIYEGWTY